MDGDKAENQDDFLTRMSGIVRLFATICLTQPPPKGLFGSNDLDDGKIVGLFYLVVCPSDECLLLSVYLSLYLFIWIIFDINIKIETWYKKII